MNESYEYYYNKYGVGWYFFDGGGFYVYQKYVEFYDMNDNTHRLDGPATIYSNGALSWSKNNGYHRLDGPATIDSEGKTKWWINGNDITTNIKSWANDQDIDLNNLSDDDKVLIKLTWGDYDG